MKNDELFEKVTIVIVTFHSEYIIDKCLQNLYEKFKKIVIENSNNLEFNVLSLTPSTLKIQ